MVACLEREVAGGEVEPGFAQELAGGFGRDHVA